MDDSWPCSCLKTAEASTTLFSSGSPHQQDIHAAKTCLSQLGRTFMKSRISDDAAAVQSVILRTVLAANPMSPAELVLHCRKRTEDLRFDVHVRRLRPLRLAQKLPCALTKCKGEQQKNRTIYTRTESVSTETSWMAMINSPDQPPPARETKPKKTLSSMFLPDDEFFLTLSDNQCFGQLSCRRAQRRVRHGYSSYPASSVVNSK